MAVGVKTDTKKRKRIALESYLEGVELEEHRKRRAKKDWKTRRKMMQNDLCAQTECVRFNMLGCLLQFYEHLYLFCPSCGNPTQFHASQYDKNGFTCGQCLKEGTLYTNVSCFLCKTYRGKNSWTTVETIDDAGHMIRFLYAMDVLNRGYANTNSRYQEKYLSRK